MDWLWVSPLG